MVISSQAKQECLEGSTTRVWSPGRTVKPHERGASMYKRVTGIYTIRHEDKSYFGSAVCTTGRINQHKRELRNGEHTNHVLQRVYDKYGDEVEFLVIETCLRDVLRVREQFYIDNHEGRLLNLAKMVCELAEPEVHSERMRNAWKKRTPKQKAAMSAKISATLKKRYREDPEMLKSAQDALKKGRSSPGMKRKTSPEANEKRRQAAIKQWANRSKEERAKIAEKVSAGMLDSLTPEDRVERARHAAKARVYT